MDEDFESIARRLKVEIGEDVIVDLNGLAQDLIEQIRNRPARFREPEQLVELVASVTMALAGQVTPIRVATVAALALIQLAGVSTEVERS